MFEYAARDIEKWSARLGGSPTSAESWQELFDEHPEFFTRDDDENTSLVWRRSFPRDYDTTTKQRVDNESRVALKKETRPSDNQPRLSRPPLEAAQIEQLCNLAASLHEREIQHHQEMRWWVAGVMGILTALIAVIFG